MESIFSHLNKIGISIAIPIVFTLCSALLEMISSLVNGIGSKNYKYKIWVREQDNGEEIIRSIPKQTIDSIQANNKIIDIESMFSFDIISFRSLGINLSTSAFAIDITSIVNEKSDRITAYILVLHLILLIVILLCTILCNLSSPIEIKEKRKYAFMAISLGIFSMMLAYIVI